LSAIKPRKDKRGFILISDVLPYGGLWYAEPNAIGYAKFYRRSHVKPDSQIGFRATRDFIIWILPACATVPWQRAYPPL
jgi:hypothetical protein